MPPALPTPHITPSGLRVAASYFAPATLSPSFDYVEDNSTADQNAFAADHSTTYENLGRITGYYERADGTFGGGAVVLRYQASIMPDDAHALAAQQDNTSYQQTHFGGQVSACPNANPPPQSFPNCSYVTTQDVGRTIWFTDYAWAVGYCLIETEAQFPQSLDTATQNQIEQTLSNFTFQGYVQAKQLCTDQGDTGPTPTNTVLAPPDATVTPKPTPTKATAASPTPTATTKPTTTATATAKPTPTSTTANVSVDILAVRVERGSKSDLTSPALTIVKAGQKVFLAIYAFISQAPSGMPLSFRFSVGNIQTKLVDKTTQDMAPASFPAQLRETIPVKPTKAGKYTFEATVAFQGTQFQRSAVFTVAGSSKKQCAVIGGTKYCTSP